MIFRVPQVLYTLLWRYIYGLRTRTYIYNVFECFCLVLSVGILHYNKLLARRLYPPQIGCLYMPSFMFYELKLFLSAIATCLSQVKRHKCVFGFTSNHQMWDFLNNAYKIQCQQPSFYFIKNHLHFLSYKELIENITMALAFISSGVRLSSLISEDLSKSLQLKLMGYKDVEGQVKMLGSKYQLTRLY